jgi:hypothetical protein
VRVQQTGARRIALMRFLCGLGAQFSVTDLNRTAVAANGHRLLLTVFKVRREGLTAAVYYCRCGEMVFRNELTAKFEVLTPGPAGQELSGCRLAQLT